jgi:hypothetical protein
MIIMLLLVGGFAAAIGTVKYLQIRAAIAEGASYQPPPEAVTTTRRARGMACDARCHRHRHRRTASP